MNAEPSSAAITVIGARIPALLARAADQLRATTRLHAGTQRAVAALPEEGLDVIVVLHEADRDAFSLIETLRARPALALVPILVLAASPAETVRRLALKAGASDVFLAPIDPLDLQTRLRLAIELGQARRALAGRTGEAERRARKAAAEASLREREIIRRLVLTAECRDAATGAHVKRVAAFTIAIAEALGLTALEADEIAIASTMHDIGKIAVPDTILRKSSALTEHEREAMEQHTERGFRLLEGSSSRLLQLASQIALTHHERWDGTGYPRGLSGESIPLPGRIVAVADVFDALTSARVYKPGWTLERAREFLEEHAGSHFDPACVAAFLTRWDDVVAVTGVPEGGARAA